MVLTERDVLPAPDGIDAENLGAPIQLINSNKAFLELGCFQQMGAKGSRKYTTGNGRCEQLALQFHNEISNRKFSQFAFFVVKQDII
jgi:hypothetical protein